MTVEATATKEIYEGNGLATVFPVTFPYSQADTIKVMFTARDGTETEVTENYQITVTASGDTSVTYPVEGPPIAAGTKCTIFRQTPLTQIVDLLSDGHFNPDTLEKDGFDRILHMLQEQREEIERSVRVAISDKTPPQSAEEFYGSMREIAEEATTQADRAKNEADRAASLVDPAALASQVYNVRRAWVAEEAVAAGEILTLKGGYYPLRDVLSLRVGSIPCIPKHAVTDDSEEYQYEEIGDDANVLSRAVRVGFDVAAGDVIDMHVIASGVSLQEFETLVRDAHTASDAARAAEEMAELAATVATTAAKTLPDLADATAGQTIEARLVDGALAWVAVFPSSGGDWAALRVTLDTNLAEGALLPVPQYISGSHKIQVYHGGLLCDPGTSRANGFYAHTGTTGEQAATIILFEPLPAGEELAVIVAA
ncbi:MAG: hypothetical protein DELT_01735 [Desulfovibrio sp.]